MLLSSISHVSVSQLVHLVRVDGTQSFTGFVVSFWIVKRASRKVMLFHVLRGWVLVGSSYHIMLQIRALSRVFILVTVIGSCKVNDIARSRSVSIVRRVHRGPACELILTDQCQVIEMLASPGCWFGNRCHFLSLVVPIELIVKVRHTLKLLLSLRQGCLVEVLGRRHAALLNQWMLSVQPVLVEVDVLFLLCWHFGTAIWLQPTSKALAANVNIA